jgi:hypothetical protein
MRWIIISFFCFLSKSFGQSFTAHCQFADSLAISAPEQAIKYYTKLQFFSRNLLEKQACNQYLFALYTQVNDIRTAKQISDNHLKYYSGDTQNIMDQQLFLFKYLYKNQFFDIAKIPLIKMVEYGLDSSRHDFFTFSLAYETLEYGVCMEMLSHHKLQFNHSEIVLNNLEKLIKTKRNPRLARRLSILPGLGQFYAGDIKNDLNSVVLLGAIGYGAYYMASQVHPLAAIPLVLFATRYYIGGIANSQKYAIRHNIKCRDKYRQTIFSQIVFY